MTVESALLPVAVIFMILALVISVIPFIPGPALLWAIGVITALLDDFERVTIPAVILMTVLMIIGSTADIWLRATGMQRRGISCWGVMGSFIGGVLGTGVMPVIGTLIGAILGALLVEFMRVGEFREAYTAGKTVFTMFVFAMITEMIMSIAIFLVFLVSILTT